MPFTTLDVRSALVVVDLQGIDHAAASGLGAFALGMTMARRFGRFNGGNTPQ
jgi:anti-anti-sigma regulatory factor